MAGFPFLRLLGRHCGHLPLGPVSFYTLVCYGLYGIEPIARKQA